MNTIVNNQSQTIYDLPVINFEKNGSFYSEVEDDKSSVPHNIFETLSKSENLSFEVGFSDFNNKFKLDIDHFEWSLNSNEIIFFLNLDNQLAFRLVLEGFWTKDKEPIFQHKSSVWNLYKKKETPISNFLLSTLWAMLNLSEKVNILLPDFNYYFTSSFVLPLNKTSVILQERQIAYRLMVIESALKTPLSFPDGEINGKDIENISFCYHAIVEREFDWLCNELTFFPNSTPEYLDLLPPTNESFLLNFPTSEVKKVIFGYLLKLGQLFIEINQAIVVNYKEAKQKLIALTGEPIKVIVKSVNGKMRYKAINVPLLAKNSFSHKLQKLIDLEEKLDSMYFDKYLNSFSKAFEGLTNKQVQAITELPDLEEEAFNF